MHAREAHEGRQEIRKKIFLGERELERVWMGKRGWTV
jgi:hypothetical protein